MIRAVADTHAIVWYVFNDPRLSSGARSLINSTALAGDAIAFSAISYVELIYLIEKGRVPADTLSRLLRSLGQGWSVLVERPVNRSVAITLQQIPRNDIPDMPDRIIAATALSLGVPLISRDGRITTS